MHPATQASRGEPEEPLRAPEIVGAGVEWGRERVVALADAHSLPARATIDVFALLSACDVEDELDPQALAIAAELIAWLDAAQRELAAPTEPPAEA